MSWAVIKITKPTNAPPTFIYHLTTKQRSGHGNTLGGNLTPHRSLTGSGSGQTNTPPRACALRAVAPWHHQWRHDVWCSGDRETGGVCTITAGTDCALNTAPRLPRTEPAALLSLLPYTPPAPLWRTARTLQLEGGYSGDWRCMIEQ